MQITKISPQKKNKNRVNIYIDGDFSLSLDLKMLVLKNIHQGMIISQNELDDLIKQSRTNDLYEKVLRFLSLRPKTEKEIIDYLTKKQAGAQEIEYILDKLKKLKLVDDFEFCRWWYTQRENFRPRSKKALYFELFRKGVRKEIIDEVFSDKNINTDMLEKLVKKAAFRFEKIKDSRQRKNKLIQYLLRQGFDYQSIKDAVEKLSKKE